MPTLRKGPRGTRDAGRPEILLESESPYGSRRVAVEYDGLTTAAYLYDDAAVVAATWIANHVAAPATADPDQLVAGQAPMMPARRVLGVRGRLR
jgi:hypothetical protein